MKKINGYTILSLLVLITGILFYFWWAVTYNIWIDIGVYSVTVVLVSFGILGILLSLLEEKQE
ncbi:hypothetical protein MBGDN05_00199 [Thermoplasmatales archaeon SCGC AB-539-N05]|nr:hypothetical protein MBGDN05_00199 [Thermoplasmatales archaeon SCGC AB-539-N05]